MTSPLLRAKPPPEGPSEDGDFLPHLSIHLGWSVTQSLCRRGRGPSGVSGHLGWRPWPHGALLSSPWVLLGALQPFTHCLAPGKHSRAEDFSRAVVDLDPECDVWLVQSLWASREPELWAPPAHPGPNSLPQ